MNINSLNIKENQIFAAAQAANADAINRVNSTPDAVDSERGDFGGALAQAGFVAGGVLGAGAGLAGLAGESIESERSRDDETREKLLHQATEKISRLSEKLIATTFFRPLLAQVREDPLKSDFLHGGFGEDAFGDHLDTVLADRMASRSALPAAQKLTDSLTSWLAYQPNDRLERVAYMREDLFG